MEIKSKTEKEVSQKLHKDFDKTLQAKQDIIKDRDS